MALPRQHQKDQDKKKNYEAQQKHKVEVEQGNWKIFIFDIREMFYQRPVRRRFTVIEVNLELGLFLN